MQERLCGKDLDPADVLPPCTGQSDPDKAWMFFQQLCQQLWMPIAILTMQAVNISAIYPLIVGTRADDAHGLPRL